MNDKLVVALKKSVCYIISNAIMAYSITLFLKADIGADPLTLFIDGLSNLLGKSYGDTSIYYTGTILAIGLIVARKYISIGTFLGVICLGPFVNLFEPITESMFGNDMSVFARIMLMLLAQVLLCLAIGFIISIRFGMGGTDAILFKLNEKFKIKYQHLKVAVDTINAILGVILGGTIGIGTLVAVCTTGFLSVIFVRFINFNILTKLGISCPENDMPIRIPFTKKVVSDKK